MNGIVWIVTLILATAGLSTMGLSAEYSIASAMLFGVAYATINRRVYLSKLSTEEDALTK